jgi:hypothetical protein
MKHNNLPGTIGVATFAVISIFLFVTVFTLLHQIVNFLVAYQGTGLHHIGK